MNAVIKDTFEIRDRVAREYGATGLVVVFELPSTADAPHAGDVIVLIRPDGWIRSLRAGETKEHGGLGRSIFLEGMSMEQIPIGTRVNWGQDATQMMHGQPAA